MSSVKFDISKLDQIRQRLKNAGSVQVGILGSEARNDGITNVELGSIQEFGSVARNIPPRSFLRVPLKKKKSKLIKAISSSKQIGQALAEGRDTKALELIGVTAESIVLGAFRTNGYGTWQPIKESTIKSKGSNKPLIDTGQLRRSITSKVV